MLFRLFLGLLPVAASLAAQSDPACELSVVIGSPTIYSGDGGPLDQARFFDIRGIAADSEGRLYVADSGNFRVRRVDADGTVRTIAGSGEAPGEFAEGPATRMAISPVRVAIDPLDRLYLLSGSRILRLDGDGLLRVAAGSGVSGSDGDGGPALDAAMIPTDLAVSSTGEIFVLDRGAGSIRRVRGDGIIETAVGRSDFGGFSGVIEAGPDGDLYFADQSRTIRVLRADGSIEAVAGGGRLVPDETGDVAAGDLAVPRQVAILAWSPSQGLVFGPLSGSLVQLRNGRVRRFGSAAAADGVFLGDRLISAGGPRLFATEAQGERTLFGGSSTIFWPDEADGQTIPAGTVSGMDVAPDGRLFLATGINGTVHVMRPDGVVQRFAGIGVADQVAEDGVSAIDAPLNWPWDVAFEPDGSLLIAEARALRIRRVDAGGALATAVFMNAVGNPWSLETTGEGAILALHALAPGAGFGGIWTSGEPQPVGLVARASEGLAAHGLPDRTAAIEALPDGSVLAAGVGAGSIFRAFPDRRAEAWPRLLSRPDVMTADAEGNVYVADAIAGLWRRGADGRWVLLSPRQTLRNIEPGVPVLTVGFGRIQAMAADGNGGLYLYDSAREVVGRVAEADRCAGRTPPLITQGGIVNGASFVGSGVSPGMIFSLFGENLGPESVLSGRIGSDGQIATELAGVRVLFDAVPAPLLFVSRGQIGAVIPYSVGPGADLNDRPLATVERDGEVATRFVSLVPALPALFTLDASGGGQAAALNQDGTVNGADNPARPGDVVVLYATGEGETDPPGVDGKIAADILPQPLLPVEVTIGNQAADVLYAGGAPGLVAGVMQVNARLAEELDPGQQRVVLRVGRAASDSSASSREVTVSVGP